MSKKIKTSNEFRKNFITVKNQATLKELENQIRSSHDAFIVLDEDDKYDGIVTVRDIVRRGKSSDMKVSSLLKRPPMVDEETDLVACAQLMLENNILRLPLVYDGELSGIIDEEGVLSNAPEGIRKRPIKKYMTTTLVTSYPSETLASVLSKFRDNQISRLPVMNGNRLAGIITLHDLIKVFKPKDRQSFGFIMDEKNSLMNLSVENAMTKEVITARPNDSFAEVSDKLFENKINSVVILNNMDIVEGIVTRKDLLEPVAHLAKGKERPLVNVYSKLENTDYQQAADLVRAYVRRMPDVLEDAIINVYLNTHKETFRKENLMYARLRVHSPAGKFAAYAEGWGIDNVMKSALRKIERQVNHRYDVDNMFNRKTFWNEIDMENAIWPV